MANRYANLVGSNKIKDEYTKINTGFDRVQEEMDAKPNASIAQVNEIEMAADDTLTIEAGVGIDVVPVPEEKKLRIVATGTSTPGKHGDEHGQFGSDPIPELVQLEEDFNEHLADNVHDADGAHGLKVEEGSWTPSIEGRTVAGANNYEFRIGRYKKIDNLVYATFALGLSSKDENMAGDICVAGLPFPVKNDANRAACTIGYTAFLTIPADSQISGWLAIDGTISINRIISDQLTASLDSSAVKNNSQLRGSITYITN